MIFYNSSTKQGICQEIDRLCDTTDTSYSRLDKTARVNQGFEELIGKIISADGVWQWDDTNQTDLPRGSGTLVEGQEFYAFASEYLKIEEVKILDLNGLPIRIKQIDEDELKGMSWEQYFGLTGGNPNKGLPFLYDLVGDSIRLGPAPTSTSVTLTNGLEIIFKRTGVLFTAVSTTATDSTEPGLPSPYHVLLAYKAALPYCMIYKPERVAELSRLIGSDNPRDPYYGGMTLDLIKFYSRRNSDRRNIMTMAGTKNPI